MDPLTQFVLMLVGTIMFYFLFRVVDHRVRINCLIWLAAFSFFFIADGVTTHILIKLTDWHVEGNPIIRFAMSYIGPFWGLLAIKSIVWVLTTVFVIYNRKIEAVKQLMIGAFALYLIVVINNCLIIYFLPV